MEGLPQSTALINTHPGRAARAAALREHADLLNDVRGLRSNNVSSEADVNACSNKTPSVRGCAEADLSACYNQAQLSSTDSPASTVSG